MNSRLTPAGKTWRAIYLALLPGVLLCLYWIRPDSLPNWFPFPTSCAAMTGLPCIFCGCTRALHHLLHGEFARALYFNWLAYPFLAAAGFVFLLHSLELASGRDLGGRLSCFRLTPRSLGAGAAGLLLLWILQGYLAVSQDKTELLNRAGPLYALVVSPQAHH